MADKATDIWGNNVEEAARQIAPALAATARAAEIDRRVSDQAICALRDQGLLRMLQPRRFGGRSTSMRAFTRSLAELAGSCASTAWIASVANHSAWMITRFPAAVAEHVWSENRDAIVCGVFQDLGRVTVHDGGMLLTGKWPFCSGSHHADWLLLGYRDPEKDGAEAARLALVPRNMVQIEDSWHVSGLKGTGSNTVVAEQVFVPREHTIAMVEALGQVATRQFPDEAIFGVPPQLLFNTLAAGPMLGVAKAALNRVIASISNRSIYTTIYTDASEAPTIHIQLGEAASLVDAAEMHAMRLSDEADRFGASGIWPTAVERARARMDNSMVAQFVARALELLINVNGASSFAEANPLQRIQRDFEIMRRHASVATELSKEHYGRTLLGKPGVILIA